MVCAHLANLFGNRADVRRYASRRCCTSSTCTWPVSADNHYSTCSVESPRADAGVEPPRPRPVVAVAAAQAERLGVPLLVVTGRCVVTAATSSGALCDAVSRMCGMVTMFTDAVFHNPPAVPSPSGDTGPSGHAQRDARLLSKARTRRAKSVATRHWLVHAHAGLGNSKYLRRCKYTECDAGSFAHESPLCGISKRSSCSHMRPAKSSLLHRQ